MEQKIKQLVLELGADVCGIAAMERFDQAPEGFHPRDIFRQCRSVIVFGLALPKGLSSVSPRIIYAHFNEIICPEVDRIALKAARTIELRFGGLAVPLPSDVPYEYWDAERMEGRGLLSMKHAAVAAGLGTLGKSTLLLNARYGSQLTLGALLTNLELASDPLAEPICLPECRLCLDSCPSLALDGQSADQSRCRPVAYGTNDRGFEVVNCNRCRTLCPMRFGRQDTY